MPRLTIATDDQIDRILGESHALWGTQLRLQDYRGHWDDVSRTAWARRNARFLVWSDDHGSVLTSLKLFGPTLRVLGHCGPACVIGALFTPARHRGKGHATAMVRAVLDQARKRGDKFALLFSDIGTDFYSAFGFRPLPAVEQFGSLPRVRGSRIDRTLRPAEESDFEAIRLAHDADCRARPIAMMRDADHWSFLRARSASFFRRLGEPGMLSRFQVFLRQDRFVGYLVTVEGQGEWNIREVGSVGGDPECLAEILRVGAHQARRHGLRRFYGWLPPEPLPLLADWKIRTRKRTRAVPMILPLDGNDGPSAPDPTEAAFLPFQDQF